jgi:hypothetical protein
MEKIPTTKRRASFSNPVERDVRIQAIRNEQMNVMRNKNEQKQYIEKNKENNQWNRK